MAAVRYALYALGVFAFTVGVIAVRGGAAPPPAQSYPGLEPGVRCMFLREMAYVVHSNDRYTFTDRDDGRKTRINNKTAQRLPRCWDKNGNLIR